MKKIQIASHQRQEMIEITGQVQKYISKNSCASGIVIVFCPHTTAGITINEHADPDVASDIQSFLSKTIPQNNNFAHQEGNSDAHIKASLLGSSQTIIVEKGLLQLGMWQGVFLIECDGPRTRQVWIKFMKS